MEKYKSHKIVEAGKIKDLTPRNSILHDGDFIITLCRKSEYVMVNDDYMSKHSPKLGGYFVRYEDGYESFSPAIVFEQGYILVEEKEASESCASNLNFSHTPEAPSPTESGTGAESKVNHPSYYGGANNVYEVIKVIHAWGLGFSLGNAIKYIGRAGKKYPEKEIEDLEKAKWYIDNRIKQLKEK